MAAKQDDQPKDPRAPQIVKDAGSSFQERSDSTPPWTEENKKPAHQEREPLVVPEGERRSEEKPEPKVKSTSKKDEEPVK